MHGRRPDGGCCPEPGGGIQATRKITNSKPINTETSATVVRSRARSRRTLSIAALSISRRIVPTRAPARQRQVDPIARIRNHPFATAERGLRRGNRDRE